MTTIVGAFCCAGILCCVNSALVCGTRNGKRATYIPCLMVNEFISCTTNQAVLK